MSNKTYRNVSLIEMQSVLCADKGWQIKTEHNSREYLFEFPLSTSPNIIIRVCSGIIENGNSRDCGKDAIRVFAYDIENKKGWIKTKRVYRIGTWEKNLRNAVTKCFEAAKARRDRKNGF
jgi:hypothetical protein